MKILLENKVLKIEYDIGKIINSRRMRLLPSRECILMIKRR